MSLYRIGIDPGLGGAIATLTPHGATVEDMPVAAKVHGKGRMVDVYQLVELLDDMVAVDPEAAWLVILEQQSARPGQGVSSMFSMGDSWGSVRAVVAAKGLPLAMTLPAAWKRRAGLQKAHKDASLTLARQMWPHLGKDLARKKDHGRAEALLIARYGVVGPGT